MADGEFEAIVARINSDMTRILSDMQERAATLGFRLTGGSPDVLAAMLKGEIAKWSEVAKSASFMPQ